MRDTITSLWHKKHDILDLRSKLTRRSPNQRIELPLGAPYTQDQSLLFSKLPAEIRLYIYHEVMVDPSRLLHILHAIPRKGELDRLGHWLCDDHDNPHMIWQHRCFGLWREGDTWYYRTEPRANSNSLALLFVCRSSYTEAKEVLYSNNRFSFGAARGVIRLHSLLAPGDWDLLRNVHISTLFRTPMKAFLNCSLPPENYHHWQTACEALRTLSKLHSLKIEMVIWNHKRGHDSRPADEDSLMFIFGVLMQLKANSFIVELNMDLPKSVQARLGIPPFTIIIRERPYDSETFSYP